MENPKIIGSGTQIPRALCLFGILLLIFLWVAPNALADTYLVTNLNPGGPGSLRRAIASANNSAVDDEIIFGVTGTINLAGTELTIANSGKLTIKGPGADQLAINGNNLSRVFFVDGATAEIDGVTIGNGNAGVNNNGGGIRNRQGVLTLRNSTVRENTAFWGGGIENIGVLTIVNSEIIGNTAAGWQGGGGIYNTATVTISNSTVSGNNASAGHGGGITNLSGRATLTNSTVSGNTAANPGGGIYTATLPGFNDGITTLTSSTVTLNTPFGLRANGTGTTVTFGNSIIAGNLEVVAGTSLNNDLDPSFLGTFESLGNNLIGNGDGLTCPPGPGDQVGSGASPISPLLGPLQDNGGLPQTHSLLSGSPAIDNGDNALLPGVIFDQRGAGFPRISNLTIDIGAFESLADPLEADRIVGQLNELIADNENTPVGDKLRDTLNSIVAAEDDLRKQPPEKEAGISDLEAAVASICEAVDSGLETDIAYGLVNPLVGFARELAVNAIDEAMAQGGDFRDIEAAATSLAAGDAHRSANFEGNCEASKDAVTSYSAALINAENALP